MSFPTWTYDKACPTMQWTELSNVKLTVGEAQASIDNEADLLILGVLARADGSVMTSLADTGSTGSSFVQTVNDGLHGALTSLMEEEKFKGKAGTTTPTLRTVGGDKVVKRYVVLGLGKGKDDEALLGMTIGQAVAKVCAAEKKITVAKVYLPGSLYTSHAAALLRDVSTAFYQELYADNRFRTGDNVQIPASELQHVHFLSSQGGGGGGGGASTMPPAFQEALAHGRILAKGVYLARDIVNAPHNVLNSVGLAATARRVATESQGRIACAVLGAAECEKRGMGAYLGVARGAETEPQFLHLTYTPPPHAGEIKKKVGIVGKGLLFDTGGYDIKTQLMQLMKFDCGGAAAVLGAARALGELAPPGVEAHFIVAATENMINEKAYVSSDVLTASNGKTIEVLNTDAEGRLTLADALVFADKEVGCEKIIELSTLTGSCMVSLGLEICGLWTHNDELAKEIEEVAKSTGDKAWRMPMATEYNELLESKVADFKNIGTRYGGSITAALFLQNFVDEKKPFAHIDIAGPVWSEKIGATGFGAKMVVEWVTRQGK